MAPEVTCQCPPTFEGALCENKIEKVLKIKISLSLSLSLHLSLSLSLSFFLYVK